MYHEFVHTKLLCVSGQCIRLSVCLEHISTSSKSCAHLKCVHAPLRSSIYTYIYIYMYMPYINVYHHLILAQQPDIVSYLVVNVYQ